MAAFSGSSPEQDDPVLADINVTPLVDVMLVLLIIFMITAPMLHQGIEVALPQADAESLPMRVDDELCGMLQKYHPLWLNIHVNHPNEITPELAAAADKLSRAGIPLGNQSVLLAGVNDCVHIQRRLVQSLARIRVRPYYLYQCDPILGSGHFRTSFKTCQACI